MMSRWILGAASALAFCTAGLPTGLEAQQVSHGITRVQTDLPQSGLLSDPIAAFRTQVRPSVESLPIPPGYTREQLAWGDRVFHGEAAHGQCSACHGADAGGSPTGTDLKAGLYGWSDGTVGGIKRVMMHNMAIAPGMDGALKPGDIDAVAAYVWAIGRKTQSVR